MRLERIQSDKPHSNVPQVNKPPYGVTDEAFRKRNTKRSSVINIPKPYQEPISTENKTPTEADLVIDILEITSEPKDEVNPEIESEVEPDGSEEEDDFQSKLEEMRDSHRSLLEELRRAIEIGEGVAEVWRTKIKCLQIAMRIISGDEVPQEDHYFLMENDIKLYSKAISMKVEKTDPEEHDRLSEDEEEKAEDAAGVEAPEQSSGTDEVAVEDTAVEASDSGSVE